MTKLVEPSTTYCGRYFLSKILSVPPNIGPKLHPNMEYDWDPFPSSVNTLLVPHYSLDDKPPWLVNFEDMDLPIVNLKEVIPLSASILSDSEQEKIGKINLRTIQGAPP